MARSKTGQATAQSDNDQRTRPSARAYHIDTPLVLDGLVNEPSWTAMQPATGFIQQEPNSGEPATEQTEVRIAFDDDNLYLGVICLDSQPNNIVVTQNRRDGSLENTDSVQILFDTFNDKQNGVIFATSPTGIEYDAQVSKAGQGRGGAGSPARAGGAGSTSSTQRGGAAAVNINWDAVWTVRSQITARGWEAEFKIPLRTLRYNPGDDVAWGMNIQRNLRRHNEQSFWSPLSRPFTITQVEMTGEVKHLSLKPHRNLKLLPYVLGGVKQDFTRLTERTDPQHSAGLDLKYGLTHSLTLDGTFNTDFAQVEVDDEQINLTRFDLFFPEKRPFFLENSGFFDFGSPQETEIFFSRRIGIDDSLAQVPIDAGVRLSGKAGHYSLGLLNVQTRRVDGLAPANNFSVARLSREFGRRSSLGGIAVARQSTSSRLGLPDGSTNSTFGVDLNLGLGRYTNVFNYVAKSFTTGRNVSNHAGATTLAYDDRHNRIDAAYQEVGHDFNPEVGFVRRHGFRKPSFGYRYTFTPEGKHLRSIFPHFQWNRWHTIPIVGRPTGQESGFEHYHLDSRWQTGSQYGIAFNRNFERIDRIDKPFEVFPGISVRPGAYRYNETVANFSTDPSAVLFASGNTAIGDFYGGTIRTVNANGGYRIGYDYTFTGSYVHNWVRLPEGNFNTDLVGWRFNWALSSKSYFQSFIQYNSRTNQVGLNLRLGLLATSSTGLFIVYNSRVATIDYTDPHEHIDRRTLNCAFLVKYNYLFDF
ncbi:MAG: hypothetical protein EXQ58_09255 [Acidobacteria bacterium]|nr:hypothetical protein [Acidobacteriota bacterium]